MTLWKFSAREIRSRPGRAILTLLSVVIGVAAVVSITMATMTARRAYNEMFEAVAGRAALEVVAEGGGTFDQDVVPKLEQVLGVQVAVPVIQRGTILYVKKQRVKVLALGIDPERDRAVREYEIEAGKFFEDGGGVLMEAGFARSFDVKVNDKVKLLTDQGLQTATVVGLLAPRGAATFSQGGVLFLPLDVAQYCFDEEGQIDSAHLVLTPGADEEAVMAAVAKRLPKGLTVRPPLARNQLQDGALKGIEFGLRMATALSLVVSLFIILNAFLMNVGERRRQLAIMRAIGATRTQIQRLLLGEGLLLGIVGTFLGAAAGIAGAYFLTRIMERVVQVPLPAVDVTLGPLLVGAVLGLGISLLGVYVPARKAGRLSPMEGMRPVAVEDKDRLPWRITILGIIILVVSGGLLVACFQGWVTIEAAMIAAVAGLAGIACLIPAALETASRIVARLLSPLLRVEGRLAQRQILRRPTRTALTVAVLFVAISTGVGMSNVVIDNVGDVKDWYQRTIVGDFFVRAMLPDFSMGATADMPEGLGDEIRQIRGITNLDTVRYDRAQVAGQQVLLIIREFTNPEEIHLDLVDGSPEEVRRGLERGEVVISTVLAERTGLKRGDTVTIQTQEGPKRLRIVATTNEYLVGGMALYMHRATAERLLGVEGVDAFIIKADPADLAAVQKALEALCKKHGLLLQSRLEITRTIDGMINGVVGSLWVLLVLGFVVAAFGIVNTLTMNVLEQTRELGLLRIVAMTRSQVRKMILAQAAIMGLIGLTPGVAAGVALAFWTNLSTHSSLGHPVEFTPHPLLMLGTFAVALVIVVAAAWLPAERAARLNLAEALQYE